MRLPTPSPVMHMALRLMRWQSMYFIFAFSAAAAPHYFRFIISSLFFILSLACQCKERKR